MTPLESNLSLFQELEPIEEWRVISDYPNYAVSDLGRIKRLTSVTRGKAGSILKAALVIGYPRVELCRDDGNKSFNVHRLVAEAFLDPIEGKDFVNHKNGIRSDSRLENLEYVNQSENISHAYKTGLSDASGENNGQSVLTWEKVAEIREICSNPDRVSYAKIAKQFGVVEHTIRCVAQMKTWVPKNHSLKKKQKTRTKNKPMSFFAMVIRNGRQRGASGLTTVNLLEQKMAYYDWKCRYCEVNLDVKNRSLDHAIPISRGGTNWTANFIPCCRTCNARKRGMTIWEYLELLRDKRKAPMFAVDPAAGQDATSIQ